MPVNCCCRVGGRELGAVECWLCFHLRYGSGSFVHVEVYGRISYVLQVVEQHVIELVGLHTVVRGLFKRILDMAFALAAATCLANQAGEARASGPRVPPCPSKTMA